jgi:hypothetical protein
MKMGPVADAMKEASVEQQEQVRAAVTEVLRKFEDGDGLMAPGAIWIVSATK